MSASASDNTCDARVNTGGGEVMENKPIDWQQAGKIIFRDQLQPPEKGLFY